MKQKIKERLGGLIIKHISPYNMDLIVDLKKLHDSLEEKKDILDLVLEKAKDPMIREYVGYKHEPAIVLSDLDSIVEEVRSETPEKER